MQYLFIVLCILLISCSNAPKYISDSSSYTSLGIDYHDIDKVVLKSAKSLLESDFVMRIDAKKILAISDITNETQENIDTGALSHKLVRQIRKSNKFVLTNSIA